MPRSSVVQTRQPEFEPATAIYVHLNSGEVAIISPATRVAVLADMVIVYDGVLPVASYPRKEVFSCSRRETSPAFT